MITEAQTQTITRARTSARKDVVGQAKEAIAEYARLVDLALSEIQPMLYRALEATYTAAIELLGDELRLADLLGGSKSTGPKSGNPFLPVIRKLWEGVLTRDSFRRYACSMALAQELGIRPADFAEWLSKYPGGIKAAAAKWSNDRRKPEAQAKAAREKKADTEELLKPFVPVSLPEEIGQRQPDLHLALIRVTPDHRAVMVTVFDHLSRADVDAFIAKVLR